MAEWKNTDPRLDIYKRNTIVILRPSLNGFWEAGIGSVETKNGYNVLCDFENHSYVREDEEWDEDWWWMRAPERKV